MIAQEHEAKHDQCNHIFLNLTFQSRNSKNSESLFRFFGAII